MTMQGLILIGASRAAMVARLSSLCARPDVQCYYFGCVGGPGHDLHGQARNCRDLREIEAKLSALFGGLDGKLSHAVGTPKDGGRRTVTQDPHGQVAWRCEDLLSESRTWTTDDPTAAAWLARRRSIAERCRAFEFRPTFPRCLEWPDAECDLVEAWLDAGPKTGDSVDIVRGDAMSAHWRARAIVRGLDAGAAEKLREQLLQGTIDGDRLLAEAVEMCQARSPNSWPQSSALERMLFELVPGDRPDNSRVCSLLYAFVTPPDATR